MSLIKNTSFYTIGTILPKIGSFIFLPIFLKYMSPSDYGIISSLYILNTVLAILFTFSIPKALYRLYYDYSSAMEKKQIAGTALVSVLFIAIISFLLIFLFRTQVEKIYTSIPFYPYFLYLIIAVFFTSFHSIPQTLLQITERANIFVSMSISLFFIKNLVILFYLTYLKKGAAGYLFADLITDFSFVPIYYFIVRKDIVLSWSKKMFRNLIMFSIPIMPGILSAWVLNLSDRIFIERFFTTTDVGIYSLGYQIAGLCLLFTSAFKSAYDPYFFKLANTLSINEAKEILFKTNLFFILLLIFVTFLVAFFSQEVITIFFSKQYLTSAKVVPIVIIGYLFSQNSALLNTMIYQMKKTQYVMFITLLCAAINIGLNLFLIPIYGIIGAAWTTAISFFILFILSYLLAKKHFFIPYNWNYIIPTLLFFIILFLIFSFISFENNYVAILIKFGVVFSLAIAFFFKFKSQLLQIIKNL